MDLWPAGLLETALNPGPLFRSVLIDQFTRIRAADRFWYKNYNNRYLYSFIAIYLALEVN